MCQKPILDFVMHVCMREEGPPNVYIIEYLAVGGGGLAECMNTIYFEPTSSTNNLD